MLRFSCLNKAVVWDIGLLPGFFECKENLNFIYSIEIEDLCLDEGETRDRDHREYCTSQF